MRALAVVLAIIVAVGGVGYALHERSQRAEKANEARLAAAATRSRVDALTRDLEGHTRAIDAAREEAAGAQSQAGRAAAMAKLAAAESAKTKAAVELAHLRGEPAPAPPAPRGRLGCACDAGDVDCSML